MAKEPQRPWIRRQPAAETAAPVAEAPAAEEAKAEQFNYSFYI